MKKKSTRDQSKFVSVVRTVAAYLVLPNLVFVIGGIEFESLPRALVNVDYLFVALIAPFVSTVAAVSLMSATLILDAFRCSAPIYYFSQRDAVEALVFIRQLSVNRVLIEGTVIVMSAVFLSWVLVKLGGRGVDMRSRSLWVGVLALSFGTVGVWGGNSSLRFRDDAAIPNLCTSASISMAKTMWTGIARKGESVTPVAIDSATRHAGWFDSTRSHNLVLVVLESGGVPKDPQWREWLTEPFAVPELRSRYEIETGTVPFSGATVPGEVRELCALRSSATSLPPQDRLENCLGQRMRETGFRTAYFHGYAPEMFRRSEWLPKVGFEEQYFHQQLRSAGLRDCGGPFRGTCDEDLIRYAGEYLTHDSGQKHFLEILTLNSHLPVSSDKDSSTIFRCGKNDAEIQDEAACNLMGLLIRAERAVARLAMRPDLPETEFIIVGDHAPPFMRRTRRDYFCPDVVGYLHLVPIRTRKNSPDK